MRTLLRIQLSRIAVCSVAILLFAGRGLAATASDSLQENYAKWKANHLRHYAFTYMVSCNFCVPPKWRVESIGDSVVRVANENPADPSRPQANLQHYSLDSVFSRIRAALDSGPHQVKTRYNPQLGYPEEAAFIQPPNMADGDYTYYLTRFEELAAATAYDSLAENFAKWKANRPVRFSYVYQRTCFCSTTPLRIEVRDDSVIAGSPNLNSDDSTQSITDPQFYFPDSVFARIKRDLDKKPVRAVIRYNAQLGYPESAYFDPSANVADEEYGYGMNAFKERTPTGVKRPPAALVPLRSQAARDLNGRTLARPGAVPVFRVAR